MNLFFDTETTGKANFKAPADHQCQPRIVQIAAVLIDEDGDERGGFSFIVDPFVPIPKEASDIHGITNEVAKKFGVHTCDAISAFVALAKKSKRLIAHNLDFDSLVIRSALARETQCFGMLSHLEQFCTMKAMTPVCKLPGNYGDYKWPKLQEAHIHCYGVEFDGAHDAMADVRACARVYRWLACNGKAMVAA